MKDQCVIYYGLIQIILPLGGVFHQEVLATYLVRKYLNSSIIQTILQKLLEHINWLLRDILKHMIKMSSQSFLPPIIVIDVVTKLLSWKLMST